VRCLGSAAALALRAAVVGVAAGVAAAVGVAAGLARRRGPLAGSVGRGDGGGGSRLAQIPDAVGGYGHVAVGGVLARGQHFAEVLRHSKHKKE
jgi:hypothetical protein